MPFWRKNNTDDPSNVPNSEIENVRLQLSDTLLSHGPTAALKRLQKIPAAQREQLVQLMHALVWNNRDRLGEDVVNESFLDRIWCQCTACDHTWLISPLLTTQPKLVEQTTLVTGVSCSNCNRVLCQSCAREAGTSCRCGRTFEMLTRPNGRRPHRVGAKQDSALDRFYGRYQPPENTKDLHFYFGYEGKVPIGVDSSFPMMEPGSVSAHVRWAEILFDEKLYFQAQQQLDLLSAAKVSTPLSRCLQAELKFIQLKNRKKWLRLTHDSSSSRHAVYWPDEIKALLQTAVAEDPALGRAWLTLSEITLDKDFEPNVVMALEYAQCARELLGQLPAVMLALGKALRATNRPAEAIKAMELIGADLAESDDVKQELKLAKLEERCQSEPVDHDAHVQLGKWWLWASDRSRAESIFKSLCNRSPESAEAAFCEAWLAFTERGPFEKRMNDAHRLCREALRRNPAYGPAFELLGTVFSNVQGSSLALEFETQDPVEYYQRAVDYEPTCDVALRAIAEHYIRQGHIIPAKEFLERAKALDTRDATTYNILAVIYRGFRELDKEEEAIKKGRDLWPEVALDASYSNRILELCRFEY